MAVVRHFPARQKEVDDEMIKALVVYAAIYCAGWFIGPRIWGFVKRLFGRSIA